MSMDAITAAERRRAGVRWVVKERDPHSGLYLPRLSGWNKFTDYGLTNLAQSWTGAGSPPLYLIIDSFKGTVNDVSLAIGATSVTVAASQQPTISGDTQLVLDVGASGQETVTFSGVTNNNNGTWTYALSAPTTQPHSQGAWVVRPVQQSDTLSSIVSEVQYDATNAPNARMKANGTGYSTGTGSYTMQFFLTGAQAITQWVCVGLSDTGTVGQGNLHNHLVFGYDHQQNNDVELDVTLTLSNG